jgi:hypothetical protein
MSFSSIWEELRRRLIRCCCHKEEGLTGDRERALCLLPDGPNISYRHSHKDKLRLERTRKAMIHIMGDLREAGANPPPRAIARNRRWR